MMEKYLDLREKLADEESKQIFDARIEYMVRQDEFKFGKTMLDLYGEFQYAELDDFLAGRDNEQTQLVICGAGKEGERTFEILNCTKHRDKMYAFCDNDNQLWGKCKLGLPIFSIYDLLTKSKDMVFLVASSRYSGVFLSQLLNLNVPQKNIFIAPHNIVYAIRGKQYFDLFEPVEHEVFVDMGAYDGMTSREFMLWCQGKFDGIYMFELNGYMKKICFANLGNVDHRIHFIEKGCWSENTTLTFFDSQNASRLEEHANGNRFVSVCAMDTELYGVKPTFIKMDIEGAEMEALKGAQKTIEKLKPRLAISVYHKPEDMVDIMEYILTLNPDYKLCLRHYSSCCWETILYAH